MSSSDQVMTSSQTEQITFPFLSLTPELRNSVYKFSLLSHPISQGPGRIDRWWEELGLLPDPDLPNEPDPPCMNLLLANRQIHNEASYILFHHGRFLVRLFTFNKKCFRPPTLEDATIAESAETFAQLAVSHEKSFGKIRNLEIEMNWVRAHSRIAIRKGNMSGVCRDLRLSNFLHLRTITISWQSHSADPARPDTRVHKVNLENSQATKHIIDLMQSFKRFQISQPSIVVMIRMPSAKREITTNTKEQGVSKCLDDFINELEDTIQKEDAKDQENNPL